MSHIIINYSDDYINATVETLKASSLKNLVNPYMKVSIKPNMVLAKPPSSGATTHSEVVEGIIQYLKSIGIKKMEIMESSWIGDDTKRSYKACGYDKLAKKYDVELIDLKDDKIRKVQSGEYTFEICERALDTDFLINVPVLKAHCQTLLTCNLKNLKGCISDKEKRRFHSMGLHRPIAYLNKVVKTHFCVIDGICGDLTFEEGGNPVTRNMIIAGQDPLLLDSFCAELMGYQIRDIEYLNIAQQIGVGHVYDENTQITELNKDNKPQNTKADMGLVKQLSKYITEDKACSACYSSLIHALNKTKGFKGNINIGQGFKDKKGELGCGSCTSLHNKYVKGCPPKAVDIIKFLNEV